VKGRGGEKICCAFSAHAKKGPYGTVKFDAGGVGERGEKSWWDWSRVEPGKGDTVSQLGKKVSTSGLPSQA